MNPTIRPLTAADGSETARVLHEAFAADEPLWRALHLTPSQQKKYWEVMAGMYLNMEQATVLGAFVDGAPAGAAIGWADTQCPSLAQQWLIAARYFFRLGLRRWLAFRDFFFTTTEHSHPVRPCLRLYVLGVDHAHRGNGLGSALLAAFEEKALERSLNVVQLECEEDNPARLVYEACGYATERTFSAIDIQWHIMTKELA
ncbi:MAG TPA: GNAT family N-acetyltransferase [bacterium]|mgnify:CR=1 FL=1|nr:GNAT family N-acetyltransferase [bacterium]